MKSIGIALTFAALGMFVGIAGTRMLYGGDPTEHVEQQLRECETSR